MNRYNLALVYDNNGIALHIEPDGKWVMWQDVKALTVENERLREIFGALVAKMDLIHEDPKFIAVWQIAQAHYGQYTGPKYEDELNAARAALEDGV